MGEFLPPSPVRHNGNGGFPAPTSRRAFLKSAPRRIGALEDQFESLENRLDAIAELLGSETRAVSFEVRLNNMSEVVQRLTKRFDRIDTAVAAFGARFGNLVEIVGKLTNRLGCIDKRSARSRRKLAVMADQVEVSLESSQ
jgi:hypothetical protein